MASPFPGIDSFLESPEIFAKVYESALYARRVRYDLIPPNPILPDPDAKWVKDLLARDH